MQVPTLEQHQALEHKVHTLESMIQKMASSPLYLEWVSLNQACKLLSIKTRETVIAMCRDERLEYKRNGRNYQINYQSIVAYNNKIKIKR